MGVVDLSSIPNLPGYNFQKKKKQYHKPQTFGVVNGLRVEHQEGVTFERPRFVRAEKPAETWRSGSLPDSSTRSEYKLPQVDEKNATTELPAWDAYDRQVLRFYGYFKEAVVETNLENFRIRKCVILYYLEDDTAQIIERKQDNSGMPQGQLVRRHRFPGPNGDFLCPTDMGISGQMQIYGRTIRIYDCDDFTREWFDQKGITQGPPEIVDNDAFALSSTKIVGHPGIQRTHEKLYREVQLGGGHINAEMQQFLEWDRKVCRFFAVQDDLATPIFERRPFVILYFLADDTVEIREQYPLNCGRDPFPILFRRKRLEKGKVNVLGPMVQCASKDKYIGLQDLTVGEVTELCGTSFFIYDADEFTRRHYMEELGIDLPPRVDVQLPERAVPRAKTPPYTGFGSWDDSMSSVLHLIPKQPRKDFKKLYVNDGKILRFTASFVDPKPEDQERLFVINFHLFDDTLSIHEPPQRNLGIVTGKFLEKGVHLNMETGRLFQPADLHPGAVVSVHNRKFVINDMDEYTRKYLDNYQAGTDRLDLGAVLEKLRESMRQQFPLVRDIFRKFDADKDGVLTSAEFKEALERFGFQLTDAEVMIIMKHFDKAQDGQVSYNEFADTLLDEDYTKSMMKMKAPLKQVYDPSYAGRAQKMSDERAETEAVRKAVREMGDMVYKHAQSLQKLLKEFTHMTHERTVTIRQIESALQMIGKEVPGEDVKRCVLFLKPEADLSKIDYVEFLKGVIASYHDMCRVR